MKYFVIANIAMREDQDGGTLFALSPAFCSQPDLITAQAWALENVMLLCPSEKGWHSHKVNVQEVILAIVGFGMVEEKLEEKENELQPELKPNLDFVPDMGPSEKRTIPRKWPSAERKEWFKGKDWPKISDHKFIDYPEGSVGRKDGVCMECNSPKYRHLN